MNPTIKMENLTSTASKASAALMNSKNSSITPVSHFRKLAEERTTRQKAAAKTFVPIDTTQTMDISEDNLKNVGYAVLKELYKQLELDKFWKNILKKTAIWYDLEAVFRLLVFSRILYSGSKMDTFNNKGIYFEDINGFELKDVYRALTIFDQYDEQLQKWIFDHSSRIYERDMSVSYFDCTNYYFDIGRSEKKSKNTTGTSWSQGRKT